MIGLAGSHDFSTLEIVLALSASVLLILANGAYVAYEFAIIAAKRSAFEGEGDDRLTTRLARRSLSDLSMQLAGAQLGITMASLGLGRVGEPAAEALITKTFGGVLPEEAAGLISFTIALSAFTFLHLVVGEMVPKNIALTAPEATMRYLVVPYRAYMFVFGPIALALNWLANGGCRLFGITPKDELIGVHTASELASIVRESANEGTIEYEDGVLLGDVLSYADREVAEIAIPLERFPSARLGVTVRSLEKIVASSGQSRVAILGPGRELTGYIHARDLLVVGRANHQHPLPTELVRTMAVVRGDRSLLETLRLMRQLGRQMAVVRGAKSTLGVVSIEQVTEALMIPQDYDDVSDETQ